MLKTCWMGMALVLWGAVAAMAQEPAKSAGEQVMPLSVKVQRTARMEPGEYWLGIWCSPVPPALRAQAGLPEKQGVLVEGLAPESPAAKAGIAQYDVLLRADEKPLAEPRDLVQAVEAAKEGKLKIELIRGGKPKTVEVTPAKRPEEARRPIGAAPGPGDWETMKKWMERMMPREEGDGQRPHMRFRFFHPGAIVPHDVLVPAPLPPNMSVVISKEADQPAKIIVKRGDQKWEVTEKELDKLPADVRPHVERMLGRGLLGIVGGLLPPFDFVPKEAAPGEEDEFEEESEVPVPGPNTESPRGPRLLERIEKRFDEMNRRLDRLLKEVEELTEGHGHHKAPEKPAEQHPEK